MTAATGPTAAEEQALWHTVLQQMPGIVAILDGPDHIYRYVNDANRAIAVSRGFIGRSVCEVFPELEGHGSREMPDEAFSTAAPITAKRIPVRLADDRGEMVIDLLYHPIREAAAESSASSQAATT